MRQCPKCGSGLLGECPASNGRVGRWCYQCKVIVNTVGDFAAIEQRAVAMTVANCLIDETDKLVERTAGNWLTEELSHVSWARDIDVAERHCTCGGRPTLQHFAGCPRATSHRDAVMPADGETLDRLGRFYDCIRHIGEPDADYRARILELISYFSGMGSIRYFHGDPNEESIVPPHQVDLQALLKVKV